MSPPKGELKSESIVRFVSFGFVGDPTSLARHNIFVLTQYRPKSVLVNNLECPDISTKEIIEFLCDGKVTCPSDIDVHYSDIPKHNSSD